MALGSHRAIATGMTVVSSDNGKVGKIVEVSQDHIVVEKGFFFPTDYAIPTTAISSVGDHEVYLGVTKADALHQGWDQSPAARNAEAESHPYDAVAIDSNVLTPDDTTGNRAATDDTETIRVPVYAEDLTAVTRDVDRGAILIEKELVTEQRTITVPVTEERVRVTRVPAGTPGSLGADAFDDGAIEIPVRGQEIDIEKAVHLASEVVIEKHQETRIEQVGGVVRREEVRVDEQIVDVDPDPHQPR